MHYELNRKSLKILANEPTRTLLEKQLIDLSLRLYERIGKLDDEINEYKQTVRGIQCTLLNKFPFIVEQAKHEIEVGKVTGQKAVHVAVILNRKDQEG